MDKDLCSSKATDCLTTSAREASDTEAITADATVAGPISMSEPLNETISKAIYT